MAGRWPARGPRTGTLKPDPCPHPEWRFLRPGGRARGRRGKQEKQAEVTREKGKEPGAPQAPGDRAIEGEKVFV